MAACLTAVDQEQVRSRQQTHTLDETEERREANYRKTHRAGERPDDWLDTREGGCPTEHMDNLREARSHTETQS